MANCIDCSICGADTELGFCASCNDEMNADERERIAVKDGEIATLRADLARVEAERDQAHMLIEQWTLDLARLGEERDARPAITREDAMGMVYECDQPSTPSSLRAYAALIAHATGGSGDEPVQGPKEHAGLMFLRGGESLSPESHARLAAYCLEHGSETANGGSDE